METGKLIIAKITAGFAFVYGRVQAFVKYIEDRIFEKSTWAGIIGGFGGANGLHHPWDYLSAIGGAIMVLIPTSDQKKDDPKK